MKLRSARLCLDCDEVHDANRCPACTSESFAYITRWVPEPERDRHADPPTPSTGAYNGPLDEAEGSKGGRRALKSGLLGIAAVGVLGWLWGGRKKTHEW